MMDFIKKNKLTILVIIVLLFLVYVKFNENFGDITKDSTGLVPVKDYTSVVPVKDSTDLVPVKDSTGLVPVSTDAFLNKSSVNYSDLINIPISKVVNSDITNTIQPEVQSSNTFDDILNNFNYNIKTSYSQLNNSYNDLLNKYNNLSNSCKKK